jgi:hypothetical protein
MNTPNGKPKRKGIKEDLLFLELLHHQIMFIKELNHQFCSKGSRLLY